MQTPRERVYVIYRIVHKTSGKKYVGQTGDVEKRWKQHKSVRNLNKKSSMIQRAIAKYGEDSFEFEIIEECTADNIDEREIHHIKINDCLSPNGYNLLKGGASTSGGHHMESRKKMSASHKGKIITAITKARMSASQLGDKNPAFGGGGTFIKAVAQYDYDGHFIAAYSSCKEAAKALGKPMTAKRAAIASAANGSQKTAYGFQWREKCASGKFPEKIDSHMVGTGLIRRPVVSMDANGVEHQYESISKAATVLNIKSSNISAALKSNRRTKGLRWKYAEVSTESDMEIIRTHVQSGEISVFKNLADAAKSVNDPPSKIKYHLNKPRWTVRGYKWTTKVTQNSASVLNT